MSNFKYPQYLTPNGFMRMERKPKIKNITAKNTAAKANFPASTVSGKVKPVQKTAPTKLRALAEKRVLAKKIQERREKGLSEEAAKAIAEAIKTLLHS